MDIKKIGVAGTIESNDIMITIEPNTTNNITIDLNSSVQKQFGNQIKKVIENTLIENGVKNATVKAVDKGAIDYVIVARTKTALFRSADFTDYVWEGK